MLSDNPPIMPIGMAYHYSRDSWANTALYDYFFPTMLTESNKYLLTSSLTRVLTYLVYSAQPKLNWENPLHWYSITLSN